MKIDRFTRILIDEQAVITGVRAVISVGFFLGDIPDMLKNKINYHIQYGMRNVQFVATQGRLLDCILKKVPSPRLRWLRWTECSESSLPDWIPMENLKVLEVQGYMLNSLWPHHSQVSKYICLYLVLI